MKALVKRNSAPGLWLEDVPEPETGINDVLIKVDRPILVMNHPGSQSKNDTECSVVGRRIALGSRSRETGDSTTL